MLHNLALDDSNADAVAEVVRANAGLGLLSVERNGLREAGLLAIAKAATGHAALRELRAGEQRDPISTAATIAFIEALEATPTMLKVGVGSVRDDLLLKRLEAATAHNKDLVRQRRARGGADARDPCCGRSRPRAA